MFCSLLVKFREITIDHKCTIFMPVTVRITHESSTEHDWHHQRHQITNQENPLDRHCHPHSTPQGCFRLKSGHFLNRLLSKPRHWIYDLLETNRFLSQRPGSGGVSSAVPPPETEPPLASRPRGSCRFGAANTSCYLFYF